MTEKLGLNLADLPSDVIWKIITTARERMPQIRLISPRWNAIVLTQELPALEMFSWSIGLFGDMKISLPRKYRNYYGMDSWNEIEGCDEMISWNGPFESDDKHIMRLECVTKLLRRCYRIKIMELNMLNYNQKAKMAVEALKNIRKTTTVRVDQLIINKIMFNDVNVSFILDILREFSVDNLLLSDINRSTTGAGKFFTDVAQLVSSLEITLMHDEEGLSSFQFSQGLNGIRKFWEYQMRDVSKLQVKVRANSAPISSAFGRAFVRITVKKKC